MESKPAVKTRSAGVVIVRKKGRGWVYLLLRAYDYWDFPKGKPEEGEDLLAAARREVQEETGITDLHFRWGHNYTETEPYKEGKVARYYVAESDQEKVVLGINPELGRAEHHEFRWMTYEGAFPFLVPRVQKVLDWARSVVGLR
jgi:bis(5'-nucleosidyl)-tetraphosphatase